MSRCRAFLLAGLGLVLAACSGGTDRPAGNLQVLNAARQQVAEARAPETERPPLTRAVLDPLEGAFLEATVENTGALAYLFVQLRRTDDLPGEIVVWRTEDDVTLAARNGALIATRGLGGDLLSTSVETAGAPGPVASGQKVMHIRARDNQAVPITLACEVADMGPETIVIVERAHPTRHLRERCEGAGGTVVNDYWTDPRSGLVWQSRQWAGPTIGYIRTRQLTE